MTEPLASPAGLRHDYETTLLSIAELRAKYDLTDAELAAFRRVEGWMPRDNSPSALKAYRLARAVKGLELTGGASTYDAAAAHEALAQTDTGQPSGAAPVSQPRQFSYARQSIGGTPPHRRTLIRRLYDLFDAKVAEIENRVAARTRLTRPENESEVRLFGALIKNFESLTELSDAEVKASLAAAAAVGGDSDPAETSRLREDLVERIDRIRRSRTDQSPPG